MGIVVYFICKLFLSQLVMDIPGALLRAVFAIILIFMELVGDFTSFWHNQDKDWNFCPYQFQLELQSAALDFLGRAPKEKQFSFISDFQFQIFNKNDKIDLKNRRKGPTNKTQHLAIYTHLPYFSALFIFEPFPVLLKLIWTVCTLHDRALQSVQSKR